MHVNKTCTSALIVNLLQPTFVYKIARKQYMRTQPHFPWLLGNLTFFTFLTVRAGNFKNRITTVSMDGRRDVVKS